MRQNLSDLASLHHKRDELHALTAMTAQQLTCPQLAYQQVL
jgi:hypothetical protein